jgi:acyl-CoA thioesterase FadM
VNLFFRRLWVYLRAQLSTKQEPLTDPYSLIFRVWLTDQDMFLHMTNSRYLSFSDLARLNMLIRTGIGRAMKANGWSLNAVAQTRTIARMLKSPQTFEIVCQIEAWDDQHLAICHRLQRNGKIHAELRALMQLHDPSGAIVSTDALLTVIGHETPSEDMPANFRSLIDAARLTTE